MADVTRFQVPISRTLRSPAENATGFAFDIAVVSGDCPQNDNIVVFTPPAGARIVSATLRHTATLGASCTAQLRQGTTALTGASTAGGASGVLQNAVPEPASGCETLNVLIAGAAIAASATIRVQGVMILPRG